MEKRKWYNKNMETSLLGFGAMRLSTINGEIDEKKGFELFDKAYYSGVNYFDTARPYTHGKNEAFVGKALKRYPRESFYLATKCSMFSMQTSVQVRVTESSPTAVTMLFCKSCTSPERAESCRESSS